MNINLAIIFGTDKSYLGISGLFLLERKFKEQGFWGLARYSKSRFTMIVPDNSKACKYRMEVAIVHRQLRCYQ